MRQEVDGDRPRIGTGVETFDRGRVREFLLDLGDVSVTTDAVRGHALVDLAEHEMGLGLAPSPRDAALGIDHEVLDQSGARERGEREDRGGRVATRRTDDRDRVVDQRGELGSMQFRQPVDRVVEEVRPWMLEPVPARVVLGVAESEVRTQVDDGRALVDELAGHRRGRAMREREEDGIDIGQRRVDDMSRRREMRVDATDRIGIPFAALESDERHVRVTDEQPDQFGADIPCRPDDPDPDPALVRVASLHRMTIQPLCIVMQSTEAASAETTYIVDARQMHHCGPVRRSGGRRALDRRSTRSITRAAPPRGVHEVSRAPSARVFSAIRCHAAITRVSRAITSRG